MSRIVQYFSDKLKTLKEYPVTLTKAVYDEDGNRLDNTLEGINGKIPNFVNKDFDIGTLGVADAFVGNPTEFIKWLCINGYFMANVSYRGVLNVGSMASYMGMFTGANYASFIVWGYGQAPTSVTCDGGVWSVVRLDNYYSATEHIVGTWTDNKPIYEQTIQNSLTSPYEDGGLKQWAGGISGVDTPISCTGFVSIDGGNSWIDIGSIVLASPSSIAFAIYSSKRSDGYYGFTVQLPSTNPTTEIKYKVTFRYTKA